MPPTAELSPASKPGTSSPLGCNEQGYVKDLYRRGHAIMASLGRYR
jgi:hypothetical protein